MKYIVMTTAFSGSSYGGKSSCFNNPHDDDVDRMRKEFFWLYLNLSPRFSVEIPADSI